MSIEAEIEEMFASLEVTPHRTGLSIKKVFEPTPEINLVPSNFKILKPQTPMLVNPKSLETLDTFCKTNFNQPLADITAKVTVVKKAPKVKPPITVKLEQPLTASEQVALSTCFDVTETEGVLTLGVSNRTELKAIRSARAFVLAVMGTEGFLAMPKDLVHLTNNPATLIMGNYKSPDFKNVFKKVVDTPRYYTNKNGKLSNKQYSEFEPVVNKHGEVSEKVSGQPVVDYVINTVIGNKFFLCPEATIFVRATHFVDPHDRAKAVQLIQKTQFLAGFLEKVYSIQATVQLGLSPITSPTFENFVDVYRTVFKMYPTNQVRVFNFKIYKDDFKKSHQSLVGFDAIISQPKAIAVPPQPVGVLHSAPKEPEATVHIVLPEQPVDSNESIQQKSAETVEPIVRNNGRNRRTGVSKTKVQQDI